MTNPDLLSLMDRLREAWRQQIAQPFVVVDVCSVRCNGFRLLGSQDDTETCPASVEPVTGAALGHGCPTCAATAAHIAYLDGRLRTLENMARVVPPPLVDEVTRSAGDYRQVETEER